MFKSQILKLSRLRYAKNSEIGIRLITKPNRKMDYFEIKRGNTIYLFINLFIFSFIDTYFPFLSMKSELKEYQACVVKISLSIPNK